jgi:hypothetical protein
VSGLAAGVKQGRVPAAGHGFIAHDTANDVVEWISGRFAGKIAPNGCGHIPMLPAQPALTGE